MSDKNSERLDAWIFFNDGKCDEDKQLFVDDIKDLKQKLQAAEEENRKLERLFKDQGGCIVTAMSLLNGLQAVEEENRILKKALMIASESINQEFGDKDSTAKYYYDFYTKQALEKKRSKNDPH